MPPKNSKKYALVKWVSGPYIGTYTHNVDVEWITQFDQNLSDYGDASDESWIIEWRVPPKPVKGWAVYDGMVLVVSGDPNYLKREMERRQGAKDSTATSTPTAFDPTSPAFTAAVQAAVAAALESQSTPRKTRPQAGPDQTQQSAAVTTRKVQVGKALFVDEPIFNMVKHSTSPGHAIGHLLRQAFSRERLIRSSYAGQKKTIRNSVIQKPALKKYKKMKDIEYYIKGKFPGMTQSTFCLTVGRYLGERPNSKPELEYVDTSGDEEEDH